MKGQTTANYRLFLESRFVESSGLESIQAITMGPKQINNPIGMAKKLQNWSVVIKQAEDATVLSSVKPLAGRKSPPGAWLLEHLPFFLSRQAKLHKAAPAIERN